MRVFVFDEFEPETSAMLQALYSRSSSSVTDHVAKVREKGSGRFMASYYVGYGHASIGDCGVTTFFLEDISLLACKAVQDNPLYSGQESSTRYIDFSRQRLCDPIGSSRSEALQRRWVDFYCESASGVTSYLKSCFPLAAGGNEKQWEKAIVARGFDILRGFLPAGVTSQTSWTTNLRQAHEHLLRLEAHPLDEVRLLANECRQALVHKYPNSFGHKIASAEREYLNLVSANEAYYLPQDGCPAAGEFRYKTNIDNLYLEASSLDLIALRPRKCQLPKSLGRFGVYQCEFLLDFGSFRDLQRHRGGMCRMPMLTELLGLHPWYFNQLPDALRVKAETFVSQQLSELNDIDPKITGEVKQYYLPIGMNVACQITYDLPEMVYVAELRSNQTVHPTLRWVAQQMAQVLAANHPKLALHADLSESEFCLRRGSQDIVERSSAA